MSVRIGRFMRLFLTAAVGLVVTAMAIVSLVDDADAAKRKPKPPAFTRPEIVLQWINDYRHEPTPERLPDAFKAMREQGQFKEVEQAGIYVGFIAGVLGSNPDTAEKLVTAMFPMPPPDQVVVVKAIAYSGLADWKELLGKFVERMPARKVIIERYLYGKLPVLRDLPLDSPIGVDANWGYYFATGSSEPIQRLVRTLAWSREKNNVEKLTIGSMVKWTLAQNASKDHDLLTLPEDLAAAPARYGCQAAGRGHRGRRDVRAGADPQGRAGLHRGSADQGSRGLAQLLVVGAGGPDGVCAGLRSCRRHGPGVHGRAVRRRRRPFQRRPQVSHPGRVTTPQVRWRSVVPPPGPVINVSRESADKPGQ